MINEYICFFYNYKILIYIYIKYNDLILLVKDN